MPPSRRRAARRYASRLPALLLALLSLLAVTTPAAHADPLPGDPDGGPLLGAELDWATDTADAYRDRLGLAPALYAWEAAYPLDEGSRTSLRSALAQAEGEGAGLLVSFVPTEADAALDAGLPDRVVADLRAAGAGAGTPVWLSVFPESNAPWHPWGQRPSETVPAFRAVAEAVHDELPGTAMVWEPAYAAGYPFASVPGGTGLDAGAATDPATDTDGDGRLTSADDPYGPYFPGEDAVDWVIAPAYHWGDAYPYGDDDLPLPGQLDQLLAGTYGAPDRSPQRDLAGRFGTDLGLPVLLETAALWTGVDDEAEPVTEPELKQAWLDQVAAVLADDATPVRGVLWREQQRVEPEAAGRTVDWRATADEGLADTFREDLVDAVGMTTGPRGADADDGVPVIATGPGTTLGPVASWLVVGGLLLLVLVLALVARTGRVRPLSYDAWAQRTGHPEARDLRIDLLRGVAICFVVVNHLHLDSLVALVTEELVGPYSGAELFVALSGVVLGSVHAARARAGVPLSASVQLLWQRAAKLWVTAAAVAVVIWLLAITPGIDGSAVTTFTDPGTGAVYDLYGPVRGVADGTAVVRDVVIALFFLDIGPSQLNILGLYVVLLLAAPAFVWLLRRRLWAPLLATSIVVWLVARPGPAMIFPSQFEDGFPLLVWQLLFVLGMVVGWHRGRLVGAARSRAGRIGLWLVVAVGLAGVVFSWCNPYLSNVADVRLSLLPDARFAELYAEWFARVDLGPGRLLALVGGLVAAYALLSAYWVPTQRALGWFLVPMGQSTLYVFVLQVFVVLAVDELPLPGDDLLVGTLVDLAALLVLWACVRTRFLFGIVPR